ncbi:MAG TPA: response regulator [Gaiellaceae bacterium]|nr:response regulator [Gaiellaceae bacterium]
MELPTGTVTFLFTDVQGSTALLRQLKDGYGPVLAQQERLLRQAAESAGGQEFGTQGDASFFVFRNPRDAVAAAVAAQRALAEAEWPEGVELRVRMGIHTGEAAIAAGKYLGLAVNRAARICAIGHGGQILVSPTTHALLEEAEHEFPGVSFRDLGPQQLKDFDRPVPIYQVESAELARDFPPLASAAAEKEIKVEEAQPPRVRILIVDDQALVRAGFRMILEAEDDIEVVGEAADGGEAVEAATSLSPDVVLMDVRMPEVDGIEATRRLLARDGQAKVVMLTTFDMDEYVYEALRAGASGFLLKDVPPEQLVAGIRAVASGDALLAPSVTRRVIEEFVRRPPESVRTTPPALAELTAREVEVLKLMARGLSNAEIAKDLVVSETTVKTHVAHVLMKLGLRDRVQAVVFAYETGLVQPGEA